MTDSELAFLVALILCCVAGVIRVMNKSVDGALVAFGVAAVALGWLIV